MRTEAKEIYAFIPYKRLIDNGELLMKIGFVLDAHTVLAEFFSALGNGITFSLLEILWWACDYCNANAAFNNRSKRFHKTGYSTLPHKWAHDQNFAFRVLQIVAKAMICTRINVFVFL